MRDPDQGRLSTAIAVLRDAGGDYGRNSGSRMAAAIAFRTVFAITPLLVIAVSIAGFVVGSNRQARTAITEGVGEVAGSEMSKLVGDLLDSALTSADTAAVIGVILLLWSSSTLFIELQRSLSQIFEVPVRFEHRALALAVQRGVGVLWTLGIGVSLTALFAANAATQIASSAIARLTNVPIAWVGVIASAVTFAFMVLMFGLVFQTLTLARLPWKPVWVGALFTSTSFSAAAYLTGLYFSRFGEPTALGVSGSVVILLFLAYVLSSVFLFGAEVTQSYRQLGFERDTSRLIAADLPRSPEAAKPAPLPVTALVTFLIGLIVGRRRRK